MNWFKEKQWVFDIRVIEGCYNEEVYDIYYYTKSNGIREYKKVLVVMSKVYNSNNRIVRDKENKDGIS